MSFLFLGVCELREHRLTEKQQAFCREYLACGDAKEAAKRAGYAAWREDWCSRRVLGAAVVQQELRRLEQERAQAGRDFAARTGAVAKKQEILQFLTGVMRGELKDEREVVSGGKTRLVQERPKLSERTRAAELLGRSKRLFSEKPKESGKGCVVRIWGEEELPD